MDMTFNPAEIGKIAGCNHQHPQGLISSDGLVMANFRCREGHR
jgi:hypothetical protein